ncbi:hypothetical protein MBAV_005331 [Candidatus Magnetobacterium bavaricum]|uniref:Uncharacterized protein n=1 Tax=Candidatus Magnetobacterium bavaricum TaxID=29290 RepID=A0A0F3GP73_9BACT|nr:hypothetical protein MBAV_005331 [Candidatus Magnetobacterium bavaricum]
MCYNHNNCIANSNKQVELLTKLLIPENKVVFLLGLIECGFGDKKNATTGRA